MAITNNKNILATAFSNKTLDIQKQSFIIAISQCFLQRQHGIHIITIRLGFAHGNIDMVTGKGRSSNSNTFFQIIRTQIGTPLPCCNHDMYFQVISPQAHAFTAIKCHRTNIGRIQIILSHHRFGCFIDCLFIKRHGHI